MIKNDEGNHIKGEMIVGQQNKEDYDEINLYKLWQVIMKRKILIIGLFLIIVFLSAIYSFLSPNIYRGYAVFNIIKSDVIISREKEIVKSKEIVDFLGNVDREKRKIILPKTYPSVKDVKITTLKDSSNKIKVTIDSKKVNDIPLAISEVHDYLNNIDIVKMNTKQNKEILLQQSAELSELIKSVPSLLATYHKLFKAGKLSTMGFNPIDVSKSVIAIKIELLSVEQALLKLESGGLEMAMQPYVSSKPVSPKILRNIAFAGISSILLGIFLAFFMEYMGNIKNKKI